MHNYHRYLELHMEDFGSVTLSVLFSNWVLRILVKEGGKYLLVSSTVGLSTTTTALLLHLQPKFVFKEVLFLTY